VSELAVLGSTGSIGEQTLEVAERERSRLTVRALATGRSLERLCEQAARWQPAHLALEHAEDPAAARERLRAASPGADIEVGEGASARLAARCGAAIVVNGIVGAAGLAASLATLERGARLALANKETLVIGADLVAAIGPSICADRYEVGPDVASQFPGSAAPSAGDRSLLDLALHLLALIQRPA